MYNNHSSGNSGNLDSINWNQYLQTASMQPQKPVRPKEPKGYDSSDSEVPSGVYHLKITYVEKWESADGRSKSNKFNFKIQNDPVWGGRNFKVFFTYENPIESNKVEGMANFVKMCEAVGLSNVTNPTELIGKEFIGKTVMRHHKHKVNNHGQPFANYFFDEFESVPGFADEHKQKVPSSTPKDSDYEQDIVDEEIPF